MAASPSILVPMPHIPQHRRQLRVVQGRGQRRSVSMSGGSPPLPPTHTLQPLLAVADNVSRQSHRDRASGDDRLPCSVEAVEVAETVPVSAILIERRPAADPAYQSLLQMSRLSAWEASQSRFRLAPPKDRRGIPRALLLRCTTAPVIAPTTWLGLPSHPLGET